MNDRLLKYLPSYLLLVLMLSACGTSRKTVYFQDAVSATPHVVVEGSYITIEPHDRISIVVSSKNPELAAIVNLARVEQIAGLREQGKYGQTGKISSYSVTEKGEIDFPLLGNIYVQGLSRGQLTNLITKRLREELVKDAVVTVEFLNLDYSVMGEVVRPGKYDIDKDRISVLEALSMAGDLTIYGRRDNISLIRTDSVRTIYRLDLRSTDIFKSPAFYIQQNDVIYVEPNGVRSNQSTVNGNNLRSVSLWISIASFLTTVGVLIFK